MTNEELKERIKQLEHEIELLKEVLDLETRIKQMRDGYHTYPQPQPYQPIWIGPKEYDPLPGCAPPYKVWCGNRTDVTFGNLEDRWCVSVWDPDVTLASDSSGIEAITTFTQNYDRSL